MQSTKQILLVGHAGFYNRGCEAIVRCTTDIIRKAVPHSYIALVSRDPEADRMKIMEGGIQIDCVISWRQNGASRYSVKSAWQTLCRRLFCGDLSQEDYWHRNRYKEADVVISIGGDNFSDDYGSPKAFFSTLDAAKRYGAKTVIWGASVGPFHPPEAEETWIEYLKRVDLITAREDKTVEYLGSLGVTTNVRRVCDPAFLLPAIEPNISTPGRSSSRMRVGIGMSDLMRKYAMMDQYLDAVTGLMQHIVDDYKGEIVMVPHVIKEKRALNDLAVCREIACRMNDKCMCTVLPGTLNACEIKHCISKCDYFVGTRTHSTIASLSSFVPTVSVGYSIKAWGINQDLLGSDDYVVDAQSINTRTLVERFERMRQYRDDIIQRLRVSVPRARERAKRAGEYLLSLVNEGN